MKIIYTIACIIICVMMLLAGCAKKNDDHTTGHVAEPDYTTVTAESETTTHPTEMRRDETASEVVDPETVIAEITDKSKIPNWAYILLFMPSYDQDNALELVRDFIQNADSYGFMDHFTEYEYTAAKLAEEDVKWYLQNIFHISDNAFADVRETIIAENINQPFYEAGYFNRHPAGAPATGSELVIDKAELEGDDWIISFHLRADSSDPTGWEDDTICQTKMRKEEVDGQMIWTIFSLER